MEFFYDIIDKRRTVRNFQDLPVKMDKIEKVAACGFKAPSHNHLKDWNIVLLRDSALRKSILEESGAFSKAPDKKFLNETLEKLSNEEQKEVYRYSVPLQEKLLLHAPEIMVICFRMENKLNECKSLFDLNNFASVWLMIENMLLAMAAEGLYGVTMVPFRTDKLKSMLNIPEEYEIATLIPFGYPQSEPVLKQVSRCIKEVIHVDMWNNGYNN